VCSTGFAAVKMVTRSNRYVKLKRMKSGVHFSTLLQKQILQKHPKFWSPTEKLIKSPVKKSDTSTSLTVKPTNELILTIKSML
jgi:hypothetical protein